MKARRSLPRSYQPRFAKSAQVRANEHWGVVDDLCPSFHRTRRLIAALRRASANQDIPLAEARAKSVQLRQEIASRDWRKWRGISRARGMEVHDA